MKKKIKFLVVAFDYDEKVGGVVVLHKFADLISKRGYECYINVPTYKKSSAKFISLEKRFALAKQDNVITIYPEVIEKNIYNAKNPCFWFLHYPKSDSYSKGIYLYYWKKFVENTIYENNSIELHVFESKAHYFKDLKQKREGNLILLKKGFKRYFEDKNKKQGFFLDALISEQSSVDSIYLEYFNKVQYFISYDLETYCCVISALCGCIPIVVPDENMDAETYRKKFEVFKYGVAYGFSNYEINRAKETLPLVKKHLLSLEKEKNKSIDNFIKYLEVNEDKK